MVAGQRGQGRGTDGGRTHATGWARAGRRRPRDGRWDSAYERQSTAEAPPDLVAALAADPRASAVFEALGRSERYAVILPLLKARTPEARAKTLARAVQRLAGPD